MRIERAIDAFLDWRELERDATPRSLESYRRVLDKLAAAHPEAELSRFEGRTGTDLLRDFLAGWVAESRQQRNVQLSAATRSNIISVLHSFFAWAESEDLVESDPSRKIRRPPKRKPKIERPALRELDAVRRAATLYELPAVLLMEGAGLRNAEVRHCRWQDLDLVNGRVLVFGKGRDWHWLPLDPDVLAELRRCFREIGPDLDDHVFTVELEQWVSNDRRVRLRKDPKQPTSSQALGRMVKRVCERAGVRSFSPHPLRHGFANRFLRESGRDVVALQALMRHSRPDTTQGYTDEVELEELAKALGRAARGRRSQSSPEEATGEDEPSTGLETLEWRRRESNPRPRTHRRERLQACPAISIRPAAGCRPPTDGLAILWSPAPGDWLSLGGGARCWRRIPSHGPKTERRRYLTRLGGECEIVLRTCFVPGCFTRPTGDLGLQLFRRTDHVETRSPPQSLNSSARWSSSRSRRPRARDGCRSRSRPRSCVGRCSGNTSFRTRRGRRAG
jgi:integrase